MQVWRPDLLEFFFFGMDMNENFANDMVGVV